MKVYDCFTFYNEFELLELRLKSLWEMVDYFVLVEANRTQNNKPKPFYFGERMEEFKEFLPKIIHIPMKINVDYKGAGDWQIEHEQRDGILYGLEDAAPDDLIFISDLDEIPAPDILQRINENRAPLMTKCSLTPPHAGIKNIIVPAQILASTTTVMEYTPIALTQQHHHYYLDYVKKYSVWKGTVLLKRKHLTTPQKLRDLRNSFPSVSAGGWHFSYMGGLDKVIRKNLSTVEGDKCIADGRTSVEPSHVRACMKYGVYLDDDINDYANIPDSRKSYPYDISLINLPYLDEFVKKYPYFLRKYDFGEMT